MKCRCIKDTKYDDEGHNVTVNLYAIFFVFEVQLSFPVFSKEATFFLSDVVCSPAPQEMTG